MDIFNNDIDNVNKVIVWMSHRMNKRQWTGNSKVYPWSLYITCSYEVMFIWKLVLFKFAWVATLRLLNYYE